MSDVTITTMDNGPLLVKGPVSVQDAAGTAYQVDKDVVALCRCGASANKPFCDGTHKGMGFSAQERA